MNTPKPRGRKSKIPSRESLEALRDSHPNNCALAASLGVHSSTIGQWLKKYGYSKYERTNRTLRPAAETRTLQIVARIFSQPEIVDAQLAREINVSREYVGQIRLWMVNHKIQKAS